jgi:hypothetical protein
MALAPVAFMHRAAAVAIAFCICLPKLAGAQERFERIDRLEVAPTRDEDSEGRLSPPDEIEVDDQHPRVPAGYHAERRARPWQATLGAVLLGASWFPAAYLGVAGWICEERYDDRCNLVHKARPGILPVIGPLIAAPALCDGDATCLGILAADAALQGLGAYLLISGLVVSDA